MFQDEAGFGRINKPRACWTPLKKRPNVPSHHIRQYRYAYGAVSPQNGESFFLALPYSGTDCMNIFLTELSKNYSEQFIILICDNAPWHRSKGLVIPNHIKILHIPPYTPEMNPIEQIWAEIRKRGFANQVFSTLQAVVQRLFDTVQSLTFHDIKSITHRDWLVYDFKG
jgi:transposase